MPCPPPSQEDNVSSELVPGLSHANFCSNDGRAEENASNAECMNVIHVPLELGVLLSFTSGSVKTIRQHFGPQNQTTPKHAYVVSSFLLSQVKIDNSKEIPQALSIQNRCLPNLNFGYRQCQVTIGMFRHTVSSYYH